VTRLEAAAFVESLTDDDMQSLLVALAWYRATKGTEAAAGLAIAGYAKMLADRAREKLIDRLCGEPATDPLPGREPRSGGVP